METMAIPQQACWMVRKVLEAHKVLEVVQIVTNHKKSMIRKIYLQLLGVYRRVEWKTLMFHNAASPIARFIMWLMVQGRLLTSDRLQNWRIVADTECVLCRREAETRDHLFGQCEYTAQVWSKLCNWSGRQFLGSNSWQQFLQWIISEAKGRTQHAQVFKMIVAEVAYHVWIERNSRIFYKKSRTWQQIAKEIVYMVSSRVTPRNKSSVYSLCF